MSLGDGPQNDSFGRLRVGSPYTLFNSKQLFDTQALYWDDQEISGSGTSTSHDANTASTTITVSNNTAGVRMRRTKQYFNYKNGKSHLIMMTAHISNQSSDLTGITGRVGYYDDNNGLYFELSSGQAYVGIRSKVTGSVVNTTIAQSDWNLDRLDGTGPSKVSLNVTKTQILVIAVTGLGASETFLGSLTTRELS